MIDLEYAKEKLKQYRANYPSTERIELKYQHMLRVLENSIDIATNLGLGKEDIELAGVIGLLHDIGRFEQARVYDTFVDKDSIDHAIYSAKILFEDKLICEFVLDRKYDYIIEKAILNHNKFEIEDNLDPKTLLHSKIIRDADKIDIYPQVLESDGNLVFDGKMPLESDRIDSIVLTNFRNYQCIKTDDMKTKLDDYVRKCALIYGLYFKEISLKPIFLNSYIPKLKNHFINTFNIKNEVVLNELSEIEMVSLDYMRENIFENNEIKYL